MRSLLLPLGLVAAGILAALPFRQTKKTEATAEAIGQAPAVASPHPSANLPTSIAPLNELSAGEMHDSALVLLNQLPPIASSQTPSPRPTLEGLPASYDDVAVPLAGRDDAKNLLKSRPRGDQNELAFATNTADSSNAEDSRWVFDRFGIPRPLTEHPAPMSDQLSFTNQSVLQNQWTPPRPLIEAEPGMSLASQQTSASNNSQQTSIVGTNPLREADTSSTSPSTAGVFQSVKTSVKSPPQSAAENGTVDNQETDTKTRVSEPAPRKRRRIYEPT